MGFYSKCCFFVLLFTVGPADARLRKKKRSVTRLGSGPDLSSELIGKASVGKAEYTTKFRKSFNVRVLIERSKVHHTDVLWEVSCKHGFIISDREDPELREIINEKKLRLSLRKGYLTINGRRLVYESVELAPQKGYLRFSGNAYDGRFIFARIQKTLYLINEIDLEEYLFSVLRWESWPGWPLEVNRAFAITCRTYVVHKVLTARARKKNRRPYDIRNTNIHQTYKGVHKFTALRDAIKNTESIIMTYDGKPIDAMYDSCCGGVIPADLDGFNFAKAPYLARQYPCIYCKASKLYSWCLEYTLSDLGDLFDAGLNNVVPVQDIRVSKKDAAGMVHEVIVTTNSSRIALSGKKIYSLLSDIKSMCFSIAKKGKQVAFHGRGFGHHLGLCQWGARQMVREGWSYKAILKFFYPGIMFMKVEAE